jgi:hypothetical protein
VSHCASHFLQNAPATSANVSGQEAAKTADKENKMNVSPFPELGYRNYQTLTSRTYSRQMVHFMRGM